MFTPDEVEAIYGVAGTFARKEPSSAVLERLAQTATLKDSCVEYLCLLINALAGANKLAANNANKNQERAEALQNLMQLLGDTNDDARTKIRQRMKRANALRLVNKLR
ncbi:MAG: hypothetical protein HY268_11380 [Deltaproteobacteria bacterium]|nr:hypothetical protein [Deltaproteobacteria bacterium]